MTYISLKEMSVSELLLTHSEIMDELISRGILRSQNNPVSDYVEWLVSKKLGLSLSVMSQSGFDATGDGKMRYQIKGRRNTLVNKSTQLGVIRNLAARDFDYLIGVILNPDYSVRYAVQLSHEVVSRLSVYSEHQNGHILHLRKSLLSDPGVVDISERFRD